MGVRSLVAVVYRMYSCQSLDFVKFVSLAAKIKTKKQKSTDLEFVVFYARQNSVPPPAKTGLADEYIHMQ